MTEPYRFRKGDMVKLRVAEVCLGVVTAAANSLPRVSWIEPFKTMGTKRGYTAAGSAFHPHWLRLYDKAL